MVPALPGVVFLSGGQSEEDATINLNAMNSIKGIRKPWKLTFSYGRALQQSCLKAWGGKPENVRAAQMTLLDRASSNGAASMGIYTSKDGKAGGESLFEADYKY